MKNIGMIYCGAGCIPDEGMIKCLECGGWYSLEWSGRCCGCVLNEWANWLLTRKDRQLVVYNYQNEKEKELTGSNPKDTPLLLSSDIDGCCG